MENPSLIRLTCIITRLTPGSEPIARIDGRALRVWKTLLCACCRIQPIRVPALRWRVHRSAANVLLRGPARVLDRLGERARRRPPSLQSRAGPRTDHRCLSPGVAVASEGRLAR